MDAIDRAVDAAGGRAALAEKVGQFRQAIDRWIRTRKVPGKHCIAVESASGGRVTRYELRPDIFGASPPFPAATSAAPHGTNHTPNAGPAQ